MALIGCGVAQSSVCPACFPKMLEEPAEISLTSRKVAQTIPLLLPWLRHSPSPAHDYFPQKSWLHTFWPNYENRVDK